MNTKQSIRSNIFALVLLLLSVNTRAQVAVWQIRPSYDSVDVLTENLLKVEKNGRYGLCDYNGNSIVDCLYDDFPHFKDGYALLIQDGLVRGNVSVSGKVNRFENAYQIDMNYPYYSEGYLAVKQNGRWGYINTDGNIMIECKFRNALPFMEGLASVSDAEGNFMHINKSGKISLLGTGFNDDDLKFATSFITDDKGNNISIIVNSKWKAFKRDVNGRKDGSFELDDVVVDTKARTITSDKTILYFDKAWRLSYYEVKDVRQKDYSHQDNFSKNYTPALYTLKEFLDINGMIGLKEDDKIILPGQFDDLIILDGVHVLASQNGAYGVMTVNKDERINAGIETPEITLNHHVGSRISGTIYLPQSLQNKHYEITSIMTKDGLHIVPEQIESSFSFNYIPDGLISGHSQDFDININVDGIEYPTVTRRVTFNHEFCFNVTTPDKVSLNENNQGRFNIYIVNNSNQNSDRCEIYVDDKLIKTYESFSGGQRISVPVSKSINMEDEDVKVKNIHVRIVERGCPEYIVNKRITFERYYANN